ncbi:hypothetical protein B0T10DRAFT_566986 [Thelonectria olida]|uniref:Uncharacterized protein n=1 Tax=Thelonectria olida TaxID=1576542 RepID=A0A9P8VVZ5_9HYPO|nr:hypothetical protein B0T10DRAFT_566986 [Thelonectria olida]
MHTLFLLLLIATPAIGWPSRASGHVQRADDSSSFQIYATGDNISGLPLFSCGDSAYLGDYTLLGDAEAAPVIFHATADSIWLGSPEASGFSGSDALPTWSDLKFYVPGEASSSHVVGLIDSSSGNTNIISSGFVLYGTYVLVTGNSGKLEALWYAVPSETSGVYSLKWNDTGDDEKSVVVSLKTLPPT